MIKPSSFRSAEAGPAKNPAGSGSFMHGSQAFSTIADLFAIQADRMPGAIALSCGDRGMSYAALNAEARKLAHKLRALGVQRGSLVAICIERSLEMVIGLLGILKAGAAYVPLDPGYPKERLAYMMDDSASEVLLTHSALSLRLPPHHGPTLFLDANWQQEITPANDAAIALTPDDLAYVIYTSGSTGKPKGAMNTHGGILNRLLWMQEAYHLLPEDRVLQKTPFSFDVSVWEFFWPLITGARLVLAQPGGHQDSKYLVQIVQQEKITTIHFVPSMLRVFLEEDNVEGCISLERVICSGEALSRQLQDRFFEKLKCELHNLYGPTEAAVDVSSWQCHSNDGLDVVPIGRPISNLQLHVLDEQMRSAAPGTVGELYIGGAGLARGYWRRPELTAERFLPDPLSTSPGKRLYRTGDLGRYVQDEVLEFVGRTDSQVKVRGFRIELGEIEATLLRHPIVKDAAVLAKQDKNGDVRLAAYVVTEKNESSIPTPDAVNGLGVRSLQDFLKEHLPAHMVPSAFVLLAKMPLSPNGKLDRKALPEVKDWVQQRAPYIAPRNTCEKRIAQMWESLLNAGQVGIHDNFFDLGGHSLIATLFLGQLRQELKVDVGFKTFFADPTIAGMSAHLQQAPELSVDECQIRRVPREGVNLPLSFSQERVWFLYRLHPGNLAYNFQSVLRFRGKLSITLLERALTEIIRRHEIFRTTFHDDGGTLTQTIHEAEAVKLPVIDLSRSPDPEKDAQAVIDGETQKNFDLQRLPLIYWVLIRLSPEEHLLFHKEHHLVHDGWSFNRFLEELFELYTVWYHEGTPHLPELPIQFADFAFWQRQWIHSEEAGRQLNFWAKKLLGAPELTPLPWDHPRPPAPSYKGGLIRIELPLQLCRALRERSRLENVTLYMTMFAGFAVLMQRLSGQTDLSLGSGIANRRWKETHTLIGMTVNNAVMRCNLSGNPTVRALLRQVRETALQAYDNQDVPFDRVVEVVHPKRSLSYHPLYQVMFSFHDSPLRNLTLPDCEVALTVGLGSNSAKWDMNINIIPRAEQGVGDPESTNEEIALLWEYSSDLFNRGTMEHWLAAYLNVLTAIAADSGQHVDDLPLLSAEELAALAAAPAARPSPNLKTLHAVFEETATQFPQQTAVVYREKSLTYQELDRSANHVAQRLKKLGIGPEMRVGICVERSLEMVIGILGILKAGGAYVPMDPTHPIERLAYVMEDAGISVLLTQQRLRKILPRSAAQVICLDDPQLMNGETEDNYGATARAENVAYVIYTSGSTGAPKGVEVTHGNVLRLFAETQQQFHFGPRDVWTLFHSYAFDFSVWELWGALLHGGRIVVVPVWTARSSSGLRSRGQPGKQNWRCGG
jgi:amino acid adenylation domain-containing protein